MIVVFTGASCYRSSEIIIRCSRVFTLFCENKVHIKFYENKSDSGLTRKLTSLSIVCTTIDINFGGVSDFFSRENKRINNHN